VVSCHIYSLGIANSIHTNENYASVRSNKWVAPEPHVIQHCLEGDRTNSLCNFVTRLKTIYYIYSFKGVAKLCFDWSPLTSPRILHTSLSSTTSCELSERDATSPSNLKLVRAVVYLTCTLNDQLSLSLSLSLSEVYWTCIMIISNRYVLTYIYLMFLTFYRYAILILMIFKCVLYTILLTS
jgi:hypothetical protein